MEFHASKLDNSTMGILDDDEGRMIGRGSTISSTEGNVPSVNEIFLDESSSSFFGVFFLLFLFLNVLFSLGSFSIRNLIFVNEAKIRETDYTTADRGLGAEGSTVFLSSLSDSDDESESDESEESLPESDSPLLDSVSSLSFFVSNWTCSICTFSLGDCFLVLLLPLLFV
jgi:hypothetical protein